MGVGGGFISEGWDPALAQATLNALEQAWGSQLGRPPSDLESDLQSLKRWFDPVATGGRLRRLLDELPEIDDLYVPSGDLLLQVGTNRYLVTPEGCGVMHLLRTALASFSGHRVLVLDQTAIETVTWHLLRTYSEWSQHRIRGVVELLRSETATIRPAAAGLLLVLLVNRNTAEDRALQRPADDHERAEVEAAIMRPALAWSAHFSTRGPSNKGFSLYRGWAVPELSRRLGRGLVVSEKRIFIEPSHETIALDRLIEDLEKRPASQRMTVSAAARDLLASYETARPVLLGLGLAFERPSNTSLILARLDGVAGLDGDQG